MDGCISGLLRPVASYSGGAYRFEGNEKLRALGDYPAASLMLARERHLEAKKLLATGNDPITVRKVERPLVRS